MLIFFFFFQAEDGIRDGHVTGVQTCALPILFNCSLLRAVGWAVVVLPPHGLSMSEFSDTRSEERRVGKECRSRLGREHGNKKWQRVGGLCRVEYITGYKVTISVDELCLAGVF